MLNSAPDVPYAAMGPGHVQRGVRRAFIASNGEPVPFSTLAEWSYPRVPKLVLWQRWSIYRACKKYGSSPRRGRWQANAALMRQIRGE
jgi:hypothetical protein